MRMIATAAVLALLVVSASGEADMARGDNLGLGGEKGAPPVPRDVPYGDPRRIPDEREWWNNLSEETQREWLEYMRDPDSFMDEQDREIIERHERREMQRRLQEAGQGTSEADI